MLASRSSLPLRRRRSRAALAAAAPALLLLARLAHAAGEPARDYVASVQPSPALQQFLDQTIETLLAVDPKLRQTDFRVAVLDLTDQAAPKFAERRGRAPIYPASVVKFVYLMAAYAWQEQGTVHIDAELDEQLGHMIRESSNQATQRVVARITDTAPGPELPPESYAEFKQRRLRVDAWLRGLGIDDLHCANPTFDGDGDLVGRDAQFLKDHTVSGALPSSGDAFPNRNAMTALGTAKLLALLATDRALSPAGSEVVRRRMQRDPIEQPHLAARIAGGAARLPGLTVYAKSGTWGPIYADAGIVRDVGGRQFVVAVFTQATPPYRGDFIAELTYRLARHLLAAPAKESSR
jgi:hypothetical protein